MHLVCPNKTGLNLHTQASELFLAGKCRGLQGRKAALHKMFTMNWLGNVGPLAS